MSIRIVAGVSLLLAVAACAPDDAGTLRIYTSVTQATVDSVVEGFATTSPGLDVEVFRAPTGELTARIAAELREGGIRADVLWLTDPLSMQQYAADGLLLEWQPAAAARIPEEYSAPTFWGTRILTMVMVSGEDVDPPPTTWQDLADERFTGAVAFPDPGFAGSSFAMLGYFAVTAGYGTGFYQDLSDNGAVQVNAPDEVVTGVAEERFLAGITLEFSARNAVDRGSPIRLIWPEDGAVALYSPISVLRGTGDEAPAKEFVEFVLSSDAQERIAETGWQPILPELVWPLGGEQVTVDWRDLFDRQEELLDEYRAIFGG